MSTDTTDHEHEEKPVVNKAAVAIVSVLILLVSAGLVALLAKFAPKAEEKEEAEVVVQVEVMTPVAEARAVSVAAQGRVEARTVTQVASEVSGKVVWVADVFERAGAFKAGEPLLRVEAADYDAVVEMRRAELEDAELAVLRAEADVEKNRRDWERLGRGGEPRPLALGLPQLERAKAAKAAAVASLAKAERDLERTTVVAPYDGRVRSTSTDFGSYVVAGSPIAELFATGTYEIRLPVSEQNYSYLDGVEGGYPSVTFMAEGERIEGRVVRVEGEVDTQTRSRTLIAEVEAGDGGVVPGQWLEATLGGEVLPAVMELPRKALQGRDQVLAVDGEDRLRFRSVEVVRSEREVVLVRTKADTEGGLRPGERVVVTPLAAPIEGMRVSPRAWGSRNESGDGEVQG